MNRSVLVVASFALVAALAPTARAQEKPAADWKWDAVKWAKAQSEDKTFKVGDKHYTEGKETDSSKQAITGPDGKTQGEENASEVSYRYVEEILAVDDAGKAKSVKVTIERWSRKVKDEEDKSLDGKVVMVAAEGDKKTATIQDAKGAAAEVSDDAKRWVDGELTRNKSDTGKDLDILLPADPIAPDSEWTVDAQKVATAMFGDMKVDAAKSKVTGKLSNVRLDKGTPFGKVVIKLNLQLKTIPSTEAAWTQGGAFVINVEYDGSLINNRRHRSEKMDMVFGGKGEITGPEGKATLDMKITGTKEATSGRVTK
jgi:hypothetical protein